MGSNHRPADYEPSASYQGRTRANVTSQFYYSVPSSGVRRFSAASVAEGVSCGGQAWPSADVCTRPGLRLRVFTNSYLAPSARKVLMARIAFGRLLDVARSALMRADSSAVSFR